MKPPVKMFCRTQDTVCGGTNPLLLASRDGRGFGEQYGTVTDRKGHCRIVASFLENLIAPIVCSPIGTALLYHLSPPPVNSLSVYRWLKIKCAKLGFNGGLCQYKSERVMPKKAPSERGLAP